MLSDSSVGKPKALMPRPSPKGSVSICWLAKPLVEPSAVNAANGSSPIEPFLNCDRSNGSASVPPPKPE